MRTKQMKAFVLCGVPGAGKTTHAAELSKRENAVVISGDEVREELYGSWEIMGNWVEIHDRIEDLISQNCDRSIVLDSTHYKSSYRQEAVTMLRSYGYEQIEAIVINPSLATCLARNFLRDRNVPDYVVKQMYTDFQIDVNDIINEPFDRVTYLSKQ